MIKNIRGAVASIGSRIRNNFRKNKTYLQQQRPQVHGVDPLTYLEQDSQIEKFARVVMSTSIFFSFLFTANFISGLWTNFNFDFSFLGEVIQRWFVALTVFGVAAVFTWAEVGAVFNYIKTGSLWALFLAAAVAVTSVAGSFGAFATGAARNVTQSTEYQSALRSVNEIHESIAATRENLSVYTRDKQYLNARQARGDLQKYQVTLKDAESRLDSLSQTGAGEGNAVFRAISDIVNIDFVTAMHGGNGYLSLILEVILLYSTVLSAKEDRRKRRQELVFAAMYYEAQRSRIYNSPTVPPGGPGGGYSIPQPELLQPPAPSALPETASTTPDALPQKDCGQAVLDASADEQKQPQTRLRTDAPNRVNVDAHTAVPDAPDALPDEQTDTPQTQPVRDGFDFDDLNENQVCRIIADVLLAGKHTSGSHAGKYRFAEVGKIYDKTRQHIHNVFTQNWKQEETHYVIANRVKQYIQEDRPGLTEAQITSMMDLPENFFSKAA